MDKIFAKLLDVKEGQVLLLIDYDDLEDLYKVSTRTDIDGTAMTITIGFEQEQNAIDKLKEFTPQLAEKFYHSMKQIITE